MEVCLIDTCMFAYTSVAYFRPDEPLDVRNEHSVNVEGFVFLF